MSSKSRRSHIFTNYDKFLKYISNLVSLLLGYAMNSSLPFGSLLQLLKVARVIPIAKTSVSDQLRNDRLISVLQVLAIFF